MANEDHHTSKMAKAVVDRRVGARLVPAFIAVWRKEEDIHANHHPR